jgi:5-formyltetrahydrofolate cyclo-ligase
MIPSKAELRDEPRQRRREHVASLPAASSALLFLRPPRPVAEFIHPEAVIGVYAEGPEEAPASRYARWFSEQGYPVALPWFEQRGAPMAFRAWNPFEHDALTRGPYGVGQPDDSAPELIPQVVFVPLLAFTAAGDRLGQGAGHYDRWLAAHPETCAMGLAWDCQKVDLLPTEPHDRPLAAVITPTRLYGELTR